MSRRTWMAVGCVAAAAALASGFALTRGAEVQPTAAPAAASPAEGQVAGVWQAPAGIRQLPIWPDGAPDMAGISQPPESVLTRHSPEAVDGDYSQAVFDVSEPTMSVFPARGQNTGAAIVVFPGGGFRAVVVTLEGTEICNWIAARGITCILSKYRVPRSNHYFDQDLGRAVTPDVPRALQDAQRTIRLVRSQADALGIEPDKIGVMGFSAGGYLVAQTSNILEPAYAPVDAVDRVSSRPDFAIAFFPGHICRRGGVFAPDLPVSERAPPTFLIAAWDDPTNEICNSTLYARALDQAGVPAEVHLFSTGGHAFGLRRDHSPDTVWPGLLETWLRERGVLGD
ncbi:alpha/beta hydrolase [Brevundimonas sp.]|uniref:alpha/beta hydrolase n=1 Tax=Brevundimonas sp. TaxID=1871086 RepID=UPI0035B3441B